MIDNEEKVTPETEEAKAEEVPAAEEAKVEEAVAEEAPAAEEAPVEEAPAKKKGLGTGALIGIIAGGVVVLAAVVFLVLSFIFSSAAVNAYNAKDYATAYEKISFPFASITSNKETVAQIKYDYVVKSLAKAKKPNYYEGAQILESLEGAIDQKKLDEAFKISGFDLCKVGNIATLGTFEQDGDTTNEEEPLEWVVLDIRNTKNGVRALLMTKDVLGKTEKWTKANEGTAYGESEINAWCEIDFYKTLIQSNDFIKKNALNINVKTEKVDGCGECGDPVAAHAFALSYQEVKEYFAEGSELAKWLEPDNTKSSEQAKLQGASANGFWLRNSGEGDGFLCAVQKGEVVTGAPDYAALGIRPCMWVSLG